MQSFRTEIENPVVERDIIELERKIHLFKHGKIDEERFRSLRLARGIYGQRQYGVQMIRIKLPYGKMSSEQLLRIADVSDEYSRGRLHITTRQDIQIHHVSLDRTPELWAQLEKDDITLREACGNAVRNITASELAGIDPEEAFDVSPYAQATFKYFLRNPICQEMGRKFKISYSGTEKDMAVSFIHDLGFIAKTKTVDGKQIRGFKVLIGGGLGSQARLADVAYEFLEEDKILPFIEGVLRVFDRHGERIKRAKARLKFLIKELGLSAFLQLVEEERLALAQQTFQVDAEAYKQPIEFGAEEIPQVEIENRDAYKAWLESNVIPQKQDGLFAIGIKVFLGDFYTKEARALANLVKKYAANEMRLTISQNILIRHVRKEALPLFYKELSALGFTTRGYNSTQDIASCPGTDTCNLGIASSTGLASILEQVLSDEFPQYVNSKELSIKISGCMNACGQHSIAQIGLHGTSIKAGNFLAPATQWFLGGGILKDGEGRYGDKIIKIPSKRSPEALRMLLKDFELNNQNGTIPFLDYYDSKGAAYFRALLKPLADVSQLSEYEFIDWGHDKKYFKAVGVGECAGAMVDLVSTLLLESEEKLDLAQESFKADQFADSIYHSYNVLINTAKALLIAQGVKTNTQKGIINDFGGFIEAHPEFKWQGNFSEVVYQIKKNEPKQTFALTYLKQAIIFYEAAEAFRRNQSTNENNTTP